MKKDVLLMFGGDSPEHEVSIITGLQVLENIDRDEYIPHAIYVNKKGIFKYIPSINTRKDFNEKKGIEISFGRDTKGGYVSTLGFRSKKYYPIAVYLAFHGGLGEGGQVQGMLETLRIPFTSCSAESSAICMNKQLTKDVVSNIGVPVVQGVSIPSNLVKDNSSDLAKSLIKELELPLIVKPVHLGSSIGIKISKTEIDLEKALIEVSYIDSEILVEKLLTGISEYNISIREIDGKIEVSEIEKPFSKDEILSFADKYQRGGKKTGSGMASLQRELPAKISKDMKEFIVDYAKKAFISCRCKGMVRIDFMAVGEKELYLTEINPIPGSMSFYLWEASGIQFKQQISDLIEESIRSSKINSGLDLDYSTDIVSKFVNSK
jgi:D-alanine-D-alanine ligase